MTPTLKSKMARGERPGTRMGEKGPTVSTPKAVHKNTKTMACGMTSSHLMSHSPRLSSGERSPSTRTGYVVGGVAVVMRQPFLPDRLRASIARGARREQREQHGAGGAEHGELVFDADADGG